MKKLLNIMRREAMAEDGRALPVIGLVSSYDPENYCAKVLIQPEGVETGWLPVAAEWVGNGWGMFCPPSIDDMVLVEFIGGDLEAGVITKRLYNDSDRPQAVPIGEFWLLHQSGSLLKFHGDGSVELKAQGTLTSSASQWNHTGPVNITGALHATGNISSDSDVIDQASSGTPKTMSGMRTAYNGHHNGAGTTTPDNQM